MMPFLKKTRRFFHLAASLARGTDAPGTIREISENVTLRGANIWMLVCSAILASIGLDVNSTAVIIGAMLISPLMSPILGVGLSIATSDRKLLKNSLKNLGLATFISLLTSSLYFLISPLGELTAELAARTTPTILDVGVAFFGGIAGIVSGSRKVKTNAIPGVAIATALMPPICTAGFGLAKANSTVFLGAFYLFFINAVFIALATYLISVWLRFPKRERVDGEQETKVQWLLIGFTIITIIPSAFIFFNVLEKLRFDRGVKNFINQEMRRDEHQPVQWEIVNSTNPRTLKIYTVGKAVSFNENAALRASLAKYGIGGLQLKIVQLNVSPDEFERLSSDIETNLADKVKLLQSVEDERRAEIENLQREIAALRENAAPDKKFLSDVLSLFPEIKNIEWQTATTENGATASNQVRTVLVAYQASIADAAKAAINARILRLAQTNLREEKFKIIEQTPATQANIQGEKDNANTN
jgi:uncharacterized hydrophobic protein (TIGR00271 family)